MDCEGPASAFANHSGNTLFLIFRHLLNFKVAQPLICSVKWYRQSEVTFNFGKLFCTIITQWNFLSN